MKRAVVDDPMLLHSISERALQAAALGRVEPLREALEEGADLNFERVGVTPLQAALQAEPPHWECVDLLIEAGANINAKNRGGWSLLHDASKRHLTDTVVNLLNRGALPFLLDIRSQTPLHVAAQEGFVDVIEAFYKNHQENGRGPFNVQDIFGMTPLMHAVLSKNDDAVRAMLVFEPDPFITTDDDEPKTALDLAKDMPSMHELLVNYQHVFEKKKKQQADHDQALRDGLELKPLVDVEGFDALEAEQEAAKAGPVKRLSSIKKRG